MAKVLWRIDPPCVCHVYDKDPGPDYQIGASGERETDNHKIVEYDYDPKAVHFSNLKLSADETTLEVIDPTLSYSQQETKYLQEREAHDLIDEKMDKVKSIRAEAGLRLERLQWKIERAKEEDLLNGNNAAMTVVATEKRKIRDENNAACAEVEALSTVAEVHAYDPRGWGDRNYGMGWGQDAQKAGYANATRNHG